jgi:hypothetical protein
MPDQETLLIEDKSTNFTSEPYIHRGGKLQVTAWAGNDGSTWGSAQITIEVLEKSPATSNWITLFDTVDGTPKVFNQDEQAIIDMVATGSQIRAKLADTNGGSANINCRVRGVS